MGERFSSLASFLVGVLSFEKADSSRRVKEMTSTISGMSAVLLLPLFLLFLSSAGDNCCCCCCCGSEGGAEAPPDRVEERADAKKWPMVYITKRREPKNASRNVDAAIATESSAEASLLFMHAGGSFPVKKAALPLSDGLMSANV